MDIVSGRGTKEAPCLLESDLNCPPGKPTWMRFSFTNNDQVLSESRQRNMKAHLLPAPLDRELLQVITMTLGGSGA